MVTREQAEAAINSWLWDKLAGVTSEEIAKAMKLDADHPEDLQRIKEARAALLVKLVDKSKGFL